MGNARTPRPENPMKVVLVRDLPLHPADTSRGGREINQHTCRVDGSVSSRRDSGVVSGEEVPRDVDKEIPISKTIWFRTSNLNVTVLWEKIQAWHRSHRSPRLGLGSWYPAWMTTTARGRVTRRQATTIITQ
jgi:hypothetical protein